MKSFNLLWVTLLLAAVAVMMRVDPKESSVETEASTPVEWRVNRVGLGDIRRQVEEIHGPGSQRPAPDPSGGEHWTYPKGEEEHVIHVYYDQQDTVCGVFGYYADRYGVRVEYAQDLRNVFDELGMPDRVDLYHYAPGSQADLHFGDGLTVTTILGNRDNSNRVFLNAVHRVSLNSPGVSAPNASFDGPFEFVTRNGNDAEFSLTKDGIDIVEASLRSADQG